MATSKTKKATKKVLDAKKAQKAVNAEVKEVKKLASKPEPKKIAAQPEPKKIAAKAEVVEEVKVQSEKKAEKKVTKKTASKTKEVKAETKASTKTSKEEKTAPVKTVKKTTKAAPKKTTKKVEEAVKKDLTLDECMWQLNESGANISYEMVAAMLLDEKDTKKVAKHIGEDRKLKDKALLELLDIAVEKIALTMDIKAADFAQVKKEMNAFVKDKLGTDDEENARLYLDAFKTAEKILMVGQRKQLTLASEVSKLLGSDVASFMDHFFAVAYDLLPSWQYADVKFYEDFAYAILSQFEDLYEIQQLRVQLDVADLYIKHGDFGQGDACYGYILRDNQIKDYIYYRYASVYETIDINRAKGIAYSAMQYVDERYTYYPQIIEIMNR